MLKAAYDILKQAQAIEGALSCFFEHTVWPNDFTSWADLEQIQRAVSYLCRRWPINVTAFDEPDREPVGEPFR